MNRKRSGANEAWATDAGGSGSIWWLPLVYFAAGLFAWAMNEKTQGPRPIGSIRRGSRFFTVDAGYRGEVTVLLVNHDRTQPVELRRGDRIAQLVVQRCERAVFTEVDALPESVRGAGGYGSTGVESPAPGA